MKKLREAVYELVKSYQGDIDGYLRDMRTQNLSLEIWHRKDTKCEVLEQVVSHLKQVLSNTSD